MASTPSPTRMEALSDGVIAVIMTIMVLEFKVPRSNGIDGFVTILPTLAVYLLSFSFTGIYWVNHHHLIDRLKRVDALILWCNLCFLFCLSLLPFFTAYLVEKRLDSFSVAIYAGSLFATGVSFTLLGLAIIRHLRLSGEASGIAAIAQGKGGATQGDGEPYALPGRRIPRVLATRRRTRCGRAGDADLDCSNARSSTSGWNARRTFRLRRGCE